MILAIGLGLGAAVLLAVGTWVLVIRYEVLRAPRKEYYICAIHGPMPMDDVIKMGPVIEAFEAAGLPLAEQQPVCPICLSDSFRRASALLDKNTPK